MTIHSAPLIIKPHQGWTGIDLKELFQYRELLFFLIWRDIKVRYKQTVLGALWAILQPFLTMVVFTIFFGQLMEVPTDGFPYPIFSYAALLPWTYFANALNNSGTSLVGSANLITKIYFPRLIVPIAAALAGLLDLAIALSILIGMMFYYHVSLSWGLLLWPILVLFTFLLAGGLGLWFSALYVKYRDIRYTLPFIIQLWLFASPVIYPSSMLPKRIQGIIEICNPMCGFINAYRASFFGNTPIPWENLGTAIFISIIVFISGVLYFRRMEHEFADII